MRFFRALLACLCVLDGTAWAQPIAPAELPPEGQVTLSLIRAGGSFPFPRDGIIFGNFEKRLPPHERGYYREYTVSTPGARNRGARRIVCGGRQPRQPDTCYYTADHYQSFRMIEDGRPR